ncbi:FUSC family protein [Micromonospora sp. NPDC050397]|uniref:FUSC family protein n=1 Tax=Micromonospora sp. NPDC050397 TaxID=3364279 RepID=UPI00384D9688
MSSRGAVVWLARRDPGYQIIRSALRLALVGVTVFYGSIYLLHSTTMAVYSVFTVFAVGVLARLPVTPRERARVLLAALPVTWLLVAFGSVLAGMTWMAAGGMVVIGFGVAFIGVSGPRLAGVGAGLQLFYILASFGPYAPGTLEERLAGVTVSTVLLILADFLLWPDRVTLVRYPQRLAEAAGAVASYLDLLADALAGTVAPLSETARRQAELNETVDRLAFERLPATERPTSANARDRAMRDIAVALREALDYAERLAVDTALPGAEASTGSPMPPGGPGRPEAGLDQLLRQSADVARAVGVTVTRQGPPVELEQLGRLRTMIEGVRERAGDERARGPGLKPLWLDSLVLRVAEQGLVMGTAARIAVHLPIGAPAARRSGLRHQPFDYAYQPALKLYWQRLRVHLTPRSVHFQGAARIALALAAARVVAGYLNLEHGFWVLLATLTLLRTSAADTRTTLRPAVVGTVLGAAVGAGLLMVVDRPEIYEALLPIAMVLAFAVGPILGLAWGQGFITLLLTVLFAQIGPADLHIVQARFLDVVVGAVVGVLAGLLLWPHGGGGEVRRSLADYLDAAAASTEETVDLVTGRRPDEGALVRARRAMVLAEASLIQYQSEKPVRRNEGVDWSEVLVAGHRMVRGGQYRREFRPAPYPLMAREVSGSLADYAHRLRSAYGDVAGQLTRGELKHRVPVPASTDDLIARLRVLAERGGTRNAALQLIDLEVWLLCLSAHLKRVQVPADGSATDLPLR